MTTNGDAISAAHALAARARVGAVQLVADTGWGFLGSCLSAADIVAAVVSSWGLENSTSDDRIVLSKGHAAPILYAALLDRQTLAKAAYGALCSPLQGHPLRGMLPQVHTTSGSLGLALPHAIGEFMAHRRNVPAARLALVVGDGEIESGVALEALSLIAELRLTGIVVLVDRNRRQASKGHSEVALRVARATLLDSTVVDGHDLERLVTLVDAVRVESPAQLVVCETDPGRGIADPEFVHGRMGYIPSHPQMASFFDAQQKGRNDR